jgi:hypothetical protein
MEGCCNAPNRFPALACGVCGIHLDAPWGVVGGRHFLGKVKRRGVIFI